MASRFWPGYRWRILAHQRTKANSRGTHTGATVEFRSGEPDTIDPILFDELVIDNWFHLEMMSSRSYWIGLGNGDDEWMINVHIDGDGAAIVSVDQDRPQTDAEYDERDGHA
jgi:hypothetical protein